MLFSKLGDQSTAALVARFIKRSGVGRIFGLCGGHIMPLWMRLDAEGIEIIDVRDERAAIHMAHAHAEVTGQLGIALVTAGPGVTNAITGIANAYVARAPVLVLSGMPPTSQQNRGALQDMVHTDLVRSVTRYARTVREPSRVLEELSLAVSRAFGDGGDPGPVFLDFPTDTLRAEIAQLLHLEEYLHTVPRSQLHPDPSAVKAAVELLWSARRPLVITGRGARGAGPELENFLHVLGAVYLDTGESRGVISDGHPSVVAAVRGLAMAEADVVMTVGRKLDFQLAYGSPAVFREASFLRIADTLTELRDNRRGKVELFANPKLALRAIVNAADYREPALDRSWVQGLQLRHEERSAKLQKSMSEAENGSDGLMHPNRLLAEIQKRLSSDTIVVADGGDVLSFARVGLSAGTYLDPGSFGCLGIGIPFGIAASLADTNRPVIVVTGDGSFGFNAIEIDTAVRHRTPIVIVVANNGAWQIEVYDQNTTYNRVVGTQLRHSNYAAMARALGMHGERVERVEDLAQAIDRAFANRPALLDVLVTTDAVSADARSGLAWVPDLQPISAWDDAERMWRED